MWPWALRSPGQGLPPPSPDLGSQEAGPGARSRGPGPRLTKSRQPPQMLLRGEDWGWGCLQSLLPTGPQVLEGAMSSGGCLFSLAGPATPTRLL